MMESYSTLQGELAKAKEDLKQQQKKKKKKKKKKRKDSTSSSSSDSDSSDDSDDPKEALKKMKKEMQKLKREKKKMKTGETMQLGNLQVTPQMQSQMQAYVPPSYGPNMSMQVPWTNFTQGHYGGMR